MHMEIGKDIDVDMDTNPHPFLPQWKGPGLDTTFLKLINKTK